MKKLLTVSFSMLLLVFLASCGGSADATKADLDDGYEEIADPFSDLQEMANKTVEGGGVAAVGTGTSTRMDLAKDKARTDGQAKLAETFDAKVQNLKERFLEEIGSDERSEVNEAFTSVTKVLSSQVLRGAIMTKSKFIKDKSTGKLTAGVVMSIDPKMLDQSILDEMRSSKPKLYERYRASEAYKRLKDEMEKYEAEKAESGY